MRRPSPVTGTVGSEDGGGSPARESDLLKFVVSMS